MSNVTNQKSAHILNDFIAHRMAVAQLPGLAAIAVRDGQPLWCSGYGWADVAGRTPVTCDTLFKVASISKVATAAAILKAVEDGHVALDEPINERLPFPVIHPKGPKTPITLRMLLAHTSGLRDNPEVMEGLYVEADGSTPLRQFIYDYLATDGCHYDETMNFAEHGPGCDFEFCSIALSLAAFVVESATGQPFDGYSCRNIFDLLGMDHAKWRIQPSERSRVAHPYRYHGVAERYESYGLFWTPNYPDSGLHCSANQLWRLFSLFTDMKIAGMPEVLKPESIQIMQADAYPDLAPGMGLGCYSEDRFGVRLVGHAGADHGVAARMFWHEDKKLGIVTLANGEPTSKARWALTAIENRIADMVDTIAAEERDAQDAELADASTVVPFPRRQAS